MDKKLNDKIAFVYGTCGLETSNSRINIDKANKLDNKLKSQFDTDFVSSNDSSKKRKIVMTCTTN